MLPSLRKVSLQPNIFPTRWQAVLFHFYGLVPSDRLAGVLGCDEATLSLEAARMGLAPSVAKEDWTKKGYITLIRNAWFLLPYAQICALLGIDEARLDFILQNDDFLAVKLGNYKPECACVAYAPLSSEEQEKTETLAKEISLYSKQGEAKPFSFLEQATSGAERNAAPGTRLLHGYLSPCGDAFLEDDEEYMPDALLQEYARCGVNAVWLHGTLATLSPYPFDETQSKEYPLRRANLQKLINRCARYGVKVYLYLNEPRALPQGKIGKYAAWMGRKEHGYASLCLQNEGVRQYLYEALKDLLTAVHGLGGILTITMSENQTHCHYLPRTNCPVCKDLPPEETAAAVNNLMQRAIDDSGSGAELIANLWGWSPYLEWSEAQTQRGVELLDPSISVMCVSEYDLEIEKGGVNSRIIDYSISNPGPSEITKKTLNKAAETGHRIYAKIQTNNSWECSAVPCLPVFDLYHRHLQNLSQIGVKDYMLTWTLGGYPSPMLSLAGAYAAAGEAFSLDAWYAQEFGEEHGVVRAAVARFCEGFEAYPFSIQGLYLSPKTLGPANLWSLQKSEKQSTMVCYAFDDFASWTHPYPLEIYCSQYETLLKCWQEGCEILEDCKGKKAKEMALFAQAAYAHFTADYLQTKFSALKGDLARNRGELLQILREEQENARALLSLVKQDARIGFEAANHYFYTQRNLMEKIVLTGQLFATLSK